MRSFLEDSAVDSIQIGTGARNLILCRTRGALIGSLGSFTVLAYCLMRSRLLESYFGVPYHVVIQFLVSPPITSTGILSVALGSSRFYLPPLIMVGALE